MSKRKIIENTSSYHESLLMDLRDPIEAAAYLQTVFEEFQVDGNIQAFLLAMRNVAEAQGGLSELSRKAHLNRQSLYKSLSSTGNPKLDTFGAILKGLGLTLSIQPVNPQDEKPH